MKQTPPDDAIFESSTKRFQSNILRPNNDKNIYIPATCIFKRSDSSFS